ncbi:hypothetical protein C1645_776430 [Glomus cerebriforme]|uniref:Secreted protein n=1 Tax=Glomus cerebriforme TaxID=658196 RepID=A0A397SUS4_9GLOM|nr:hypothetical protein C1645_776430 [Glomus cerebriforme]
MRVFKISLFFLLFIFWSCSCFSFITHIVYITGPSICYKLQIFVHCVICVIPRVIQHHARICEYQSNIVVNNKQI